jgi:rod shape-determining protein MreD
MKGRFIAYAVSYIIIVILVGVFSRYLQFLGAAPEIFLIFLAAASLREGPHFGVIFGFLTGLFADFISVYLPGAHCLLYTAVGYICGSLSGKFYTDSAQNRIFVTLSATVFVRAGLWLAGETFGLRYNPSLQWIALTIIYNVLASWLIFPAAAAAGRFVDKRNPSRARNG